MLERRINNLLLTILIAIGLLTSLSAVKARVSKTSAIAQSAIAHTETIQSDETSLRFTLTTPRLSIADQGNVLAAGLTAYIQEPGAPALPHYATFILLPPEATASVTVRALDVANRAVAPIASVPQPANQVEGMEMKSETAVSPTINPYQAQPPARVNAPDPAIYQQDAFYPDALYSLSEPFYYRDLRLVELRLYPIRYNPINSELHHAQQLDVAIQFDGAQWDNLRPVPTSNDAYLNGLSDTILNFDHALNWRSLPANLAAQETKFPVNAAETFKIELDQDGIYEVTQAELLAAGMDITNVNPAEIAMMHQGQPVAYQLVNDDGDAVFDTNEKIRFYGWAFDGPRTDKQFITNNVFWLWADPTNTPTTIPTTANQTGGAITTSAVMTVTREPETFFTSTYTNQWDNFPNQPDNWYWDYFEQDEFGTIVTRTYTITLPNPVLGSPNDAIYTVELLSRDKPTAPANLTYNVTAYMNDYSTESTAVWTYIKNVNITDSVPSSELRDQANNFDLVFASNGAFAKIYLNRITVRYTGKLTAVNDQLIFGDETGGLREFQVDGFVENNAANVLIWNTTVPTSPVQIEMSAGDISGGVYSIGSNHAAGAEFIATTTANTISPIKITEYNPVSLEPSGSGADWIAISHANFITQAVRLADHRANASYGGLTTQVVDYEDVVNQYGYGLPLPAAIHDYLAYALGNWSPAPGYVILFGSATYNPRNLECNHSTCPRIGTWTWDANQPTFIATDLVYEDRFQGLIPSDHTMVLLTGNDFVPDMAIGRITADTLDEAKAAVSKIILYEQIQLAGANWQNNLLFVADNADNAGDFYAENLTTAANHIPDNFNVNQLYLLTDDSAETAALRDAMLNDVNGTGVSILNYRGHGSVTRWAEINPIITSDVASLDFWGNFDKPTVILSADCLDGNFAFPGIPALSKTLLTLSNGTTPVGSAAHWSSTGLGYTDEHSVLHRSFYDGLFEQNMRTIGEAVNHAKMMYDLGGYDKSELYSFMLQGDPAMQLFRLRNQTHLPAILNN